jgi:hypothetical protein
MLAAPLLYCTNVLFTLFDVYSFGTFFTFTITFVPLSSNWHRVYCDYIIWLLAHPLLARCVSFLTERGGGGGDGWVNLLNNGAASKKIFLKAKCQQLAAHPLVGRPSLNN